MVPCQSKTLITALCVTGPFANGTMITSEIKVRIKKALTSDVSF